MWPMHRVRVHSRGAAHCVVRNRLCTVFLKAHACCPVMKLNRMTANGLHNHQPPASAHRGEFLLVDYTVAACAPQALAFPLHQGGRQVAVGRRNECEVPACGCHHLCHDSVNGARSTRSLHLRPRSSSILRGVAPRPLRNGNGLCGQHIRLGANLPRSHPQPPPWTAHTRSSSSRFILHPFARLSHLVPQRQRATRRVLAAPKRWHQLFSPAWRPRPCDRRALDCCLQARLPIVVIRPCATSGAQSCRRASIAVAQYASRRRGGRIHAQSCGGAVWR